MHVVSTLTHRTKKIAFFKQSDLLLLYTHTQQEDRQSGRKTKRKLQVLKEYKNNASGNGDMTRSLP